MATIRIFWAPWKICLAFFIGLSVALGWKFYQESGPSVIIQSVDISDDTVEAGVDGDTISFVLKIDRIHSCPTMVSRYVWHYVDYHGDKMKDFHSIDNPPLTPMPGDGEQMYMITLRVPGNLPAGPWYERTVTLPQCSAFSWLSVTRNTPMVEDRPIKVVSQ